MKAYRRAQPCDAPGCGVTWVREFRAWPGDRNKVWYTLMRSEGWHISFPHVRGHGKVPTFVCPDCQKKGELQPYSTIRYEFVAR